VLRAYGEELAAAGAAQAGGTFTDLAPADELIKHSPEAFLLGVLFTQGIPAERAWAGPYLLGERLGTLDLEYLAASATEVARAVAEPPALHRFVHTLPRWIVSAASRVSAEYSGSATSIWPDGTHVLEVVRRLRAFDGIGEKKAAMAVEILVRHFGVALNGIECGSVAYDVQVRRVFLRSGLVIADTPQQVRDAACRIAPDSPGTLDLAAWLIGRETCRPRQPVCEECRLGGVCPRLTDLDVEGVGSRRAQPSGRNSSPDSSLG
jgi:uncharacterized HhH-GPD family protein